MKTVALLMGMMLICCSMVVAMDTPGRAGPPAAPEVVDGRAYTGIIKNKTRYEIWIPSDNSDATLKIPPYSWTEYIIWTKTLDVTAYHNGKPFYCLKLMVHPQEYSFKCKKYDFMAEIIKKEPGQRYKPLRKRVRRKPNC